MGRYSKYMKEIWSLQANRKVLSLTLFGVVIDNKTAFTPGQQLTISDDTIEALKMLISKGYDFLFIAGQPQNRTRNLEIQDFENILSAMREIIGKLGGRIKNAYYAPGVDKNDPYVKPNTGMFERAQNEGFVKWPGTYHVGSDNTDVKSSNKIGATPVLITNGVTSKSKAFEITNNIKIKEFVSFLDLEK